MAEDGAGPGQPNGRTRELDALNAVVDQLADHPVLWLVLQADEGVGLVG